MYGTKDSTYDRDDTENMIAALICGVHGIERMYFGGVFVYGIASSSKFGHVAESGKYSNDGLVWPVKENKAETVY